MKLPTVLAALLGGLSVLATLVVPTKVYDTSQTVSCGFPFTISSVRYERFNPPLPYEFTCPGNPMEDPVSFSFLNFFMSFVFFFGCFYTFFLLVDMVAARLGARRVYQGVIAGLLILIIFQWIRHTAQVSDLNNQIMTYEEAVELVQHQYPAFREYSWIRSDDMRNATKYIDSERTEDGYFVRFTEVKRLPSGQSLIVKAKCFRVLYFSDVEQVHMVGSYDSADGVERKELSSKTCE